MEEHKGFFDLLSPKSALVVGLVGGLMTLCTLGFFVLLSKEMGAGTLFAANNDTYNLPSNPTPQPVQPSNNQPAPAAAMPALTNKDHIRGDKNAPVTLVVYSDYECPFCKTFHPTTVQALQKYAGKLKMVFRHYPLPFHTNAAKEAEAAECVAELGGNDAFWKFTDKIFERTTSNGNGIALDALPSIAAEVGVNQSKFKSCLDSGKYASAIQDSMDKAGAAGVNGTPGSFLVAKDGSTQLISGAVPLSQLQSAIEAALAK